MGTEQQNKPKIQRIFCELSAKEIFDVEQMTTLVRMGLSGGFGWDKLLESQRVLIISEAGAGKTYECRAQQQALWNQGEPAFYLELAELTKDKLEDLLSADEVERFKAWRISQSDVATFFLDSIDELKLTLGSFETALKRLGNAIAGQLGRVRIVITTRPIPIDQHLIQTHLPIPDPVEQVARADAFADIAMGRHQERKPDNDAEVTPSWRNVALMPLSNSQIREMAILEGISDADALLADIQARNAEDFARRPQDLIELCADWRDYRRIRTHREQIEQNIRVKLKPRTDRREPAQLSPDKAFEGAYRLALATLLTRKLTIRHSVEADRHGEPGTVLEPALILSDWTPEERETLLERALFGFASYGRVRFHHRSVIEFLAAQHLDNRLNQGMPIKAVKRLLFATTPQGFRVVRPTMRPVAAWLAASHPSIFSEIHDHEPDVLLDYADPASLPLPLRVSVLQSYVQIYGNGGGRGQHIPRMQVQRFASPELSECVLALWQTNIENYEVRELLLELIGAGKMLKCADIVHAVAANQATDKHEHFQAITALTQLNDPRIESLVFSMEEEPKIWPEPIVRGAIVSMFPQHITPDQLCTILSHLHVSDRAIGEIEFILPHRIDELEFAPGYLRKLSVCLADLITENLTWNKDWPHTTSIRPHLLPLLRAISLKLVRTGEIDSEVLRSAVIALRLKCENHDHDKHTENLRQALAVLAPSLRERAFWIDDAFCENLHPQTDARERLFQALFHGPIDLNNAQDEAWMRHILADHDRPLVERTMMLHALMREPTDKILQDCKECVGEEPSLIALIDSHLEPREIDTEWAEHNARSEQRRKDRKKQDAENHATWIAFWHEVAEHPEMAFSPDREENTVWNLWKAMSRSGDKSRASGWNRRFIEQHFGKEIADQVRISMRQIWRNDRPTLRYERPKNERNTFLVRWQLGLAALAAEAEAPHWTSKLSIEEAELAARYVPIEFNGYPAWLEALTREHPGSVERTLGPELSAELKELATSGALSIQLQNISHAPKIIAQLFLSRLRSWLEDHSCGGFSKEHASGLERVLQILIEHGDDETKIHIRHMAESQLELSADSSLTPVWLAVFMRLDPAAGTDALEQLLEPVEPAPSTVAVHIIGALFGDRHARPNIDLHMPNFTPQLLLRLVRLAYRHVRRSDDITHHGAYSPNSRDEAQDGRNAILNAILDSKGLEAWAVKLKMVGDPLFGHFRDRLALLAREKAAEEIDENIFNESEVVQLNGYGEVPPVTRDDMFELLVDRLDDLDDLLLQEDSPREAWALIEDEKIMRREIARALRGASNQQYIVDQEAVTADEKETDIRLRAISGQQATIELKVGEKGWSGRVLRDTIKNQLVTKYMAAETCRSGCLLVTVASDRQWQHPDTDEKIDIDGLRGVLTAEANRIVDELCGSIRLVIKVMDLRPRLP